MARKTKRRAAVAIDWQSRAEDLEARLVTVEALTRAAEEALMELPFVVNAKARRAIGRLYALVQAAAASARKPN